MEQEKVIVQKQARIGYVHLPYEVINHQREKVQALLSTGKVLVDRPHPSGRGRTLVLQSILFDVTPGVYVGDHYAIHCTQDEGFREFYTLAAVGQPEQELPEYQIDVCPETETMKDPEAEKRHRLVGPFKITATRNTIVRVPTARVGIQAAAPGAFTSRGNRILH